MEFLEHMDSLLRTFWLVAIPVSIIFLIQTVLTFIGSDASDGISADFDGNLDGADAPFQLFSFRNLINFLLGFSWSGISFYSLIQNKTVLILVALLVGVLFVYLFFFIIRQVQKLAEDNSFSISLALNKTGEVYIPIPAAKTGTGKVTMSIKGSIHELDAMSEGDRIPSNTKVKVIRIESNSILIVEPIR